MNEQARHQRAIQPDQPFEMEGTGASAADSGGGADSGVPTPKLA